MTVHPYDTDHPPHALLQVLWRSTVCLAMVFGSPAAAVADTQDLRAVEARKVFDDKSEFKEPSGLALSRAGDVLYAVSDNVSAVFTLDLNGKILSRQTLAQQVKDLEGIAVLPDGTLLVLQEKPGAIYIVDPSQKTPTKVVAIADLKGFATVRDAVAKAPERKGFEGIAAHPQTGEVFLVHEGQPRLLLQISADLKTLTHAWLLGAGIGFVSPHADDQALDVSAVTIDAENGTILLLSDTGKSLFIFDPNTVRAQRIDLFRKSNGGTKTIKNAEGLALGPANERMFIVTDDKKDSRFLTFNRPGQ